MKMHTDQFEFDYWQSIAEKDPQGFEQARARVLDSLIESAPEHVQRRLRGLQWQIDQVRARADNPLVACFRISDMMWDSVLGEDGLVAHIEELTGDRPRAPRERTAASVLPFARRSQDN